MKYFGMTDVGMKRAVNQDSFDVREYASGVLLTVCDGMGGVNGGAEASSTAVTAFTGYADLKLDVAGAVDTDTVKDTLTSAAKAANKAVFKASEQNDELHGMGTTLVSAYIGENGIFAVNVGDSRLYYVYGETIAQVTKDHSYVQYLVDIGKLTAEQAKESSGKNIITRAVGTEEDVEVDFFSLDAAPGGHLLLCSDGLTNHVSEEEIIRILNDCPSPEEACEALVYLANKNGGSDNITAVVASL